MDKPWKVRIEASKVLIDLELHHKGLDAALLLFLKYVDEEKSLRGWLAGVLFSFLHALISFDMHLLQERRSWLFMSCVYVKQVLFPTLMIK